MGDIESHDETKAKSRYAGPHTTIVSLILHCTLCNPSIGIGGSFSELSWSSLASAPWAPMNSPSSYATDVQIYAARLTEYGI